MLSRLRQKRHTRQSNINSGSGSPRHTARNQPGRGGTCRSMLPLANRLAKRHHQAATRPAYCKGNIDRPGARVRDLLKKIGDAEAVALGAILGGIMFFGAIFLFVVGLQVAKRLADDTKATASAQILNITLVPLERTHSVNLAIAQAQNKGVDVAMVRNIDEWRMSGPDNSRRVLLYREPASGPYNVIFLCAIARDDVSVAQLIPGSFTKTATELGPRANCGRALARANDF